MQKRGMQPDSTPSDTRAQGARSASKPSDASDEKARTLAEHPWMAHETVGFTLPIERAEQFAAACESASLGPRWVNAAGEKVAIVRCALLDQPDDARSVFYPGESDF